LLKAIALREGIGGAVTDGSGTIAVSGTAQNMFSGGVPSNGYMVQNTSSGTLYISDIGAASAAGAGSTSIALQPGVLFETPVNYKPPGAVSIYGATAGQTFVARKW
jgi:hypothetical protein